MIPRRRQRPSGSLVERPVARLFSVATRSLSRWRQWRALRRAQTLAQEADRLHIGHRLHRGASFLGGE